jgi:hypothetical protein
MDWKPWSLALARRRQRPPVMQTARIKSGRLIPEFQSKNPFKAAANPRFTRKTLDAAVLADEIGDAVTGMGVVHVFTGRMAPLGY